MQPTFACFCDCIIIDWWLNHWSWVPCLCTVYCVQTVSMVKKKTKALPEFCSQTTIRHIQCYLETLWKQLQYVANNLNSTIKEVSWNSLWVIISITITKYVLLFHCSLDPPWPPGKPTIKDVAKTSAFLQWTKPEHDGGAKIESYIIELLKSGTEEWVRVADGINILEHFLKGLMEKQEYSFRIRAVNAAGESDPSEPSDPVLCKERLSE